MVNPVRVGLFGHGWWCRRYLVPALRGAEAEVAAVCGRDGARAAAAAEEFGAPRSYDRLEPMVGDGGLDAVVIASPPASHLAAVTAAAEHGLAVFCEKPLARTAAESAKMLAACQAVPSIVGFTQRWNPAVRTVRRLLRVGAIGEIRHLRYATASVLSADATAPWDWRYDANEYAYGVLSDLGPHAVDLTRWLTGAEITSVSAAGSTVFPARDTADGGIREVENWDECTLTARLDSGIQAALVVSRVLPASPYHRFRNELEIIGSEGTLAYSSAHPAEVALTPSAGEPTAVPAEGLDLGEAAPGSFQELMVTMKNGAAAQAADMIAVFRGEPRPEAPTMADGHASQLVLDAAAQSARESRWTPCPPG